MGTCNGYNLQILENFVYMLLLSLKLKKTPNDLKFLFCFPPQTDNVQVETSSFILLLSFSLVSHRLYFMYFFCALYLKHKYVIFIFTIFLFFVFVFFLLQMCLYSNSLNLVLYFIWESLLLSKSILIILFYCQDHYSWYNFDFVTQFTYFCFVMCQGNLLYLPILIISICSCQMFLCNTNNSSSLSCTFYVTTAL